MAVPNPRATCLLCWRNIPPLTVEEFDLECEGSEDNPLKIKDSLDLFVIDQVLNISKEWCQQHKLMDCDGKLKLIQICDDCSSTGVFKAWKIANQIKMLTEQLAEVKADIIEVMKERMYRRQRGKIRDQSGKRTLEDVYAEIIQESDSNRTSEGQIANVLTSRGTSTTENICNEVCKNKKETLPELPSSSRESAIDQTVPSHEKDEDDDFFPPDDTDIDPSFNMSDANSSESDDPDVKPARAPKKPRLSRCTRCQTRLSPEALKSHMELHEINDNLGEASFTCEKCQFPCQSEIELSSHNHNRHVIPSRCQIRSCPLCTYSTKIWLHLKRHTDEEHPDATPEQLGPEILLKCLQCSIQFSSIRQYDLHRKSVHESSSAACECTTCGVLFETSDKLLHHVLNTHERSCTLVCEVCGMGFRRQIHLDSHMITHNKSKRDLVCEICGIDYLHQFSLDDHYKKHHSNKPSDGNAPQKLHKCRYCNLTSPFRVVILRHLKTHKEESGQKCQLCDKTYINSNGLKRHLVINHPQTDGKYKCPHCFKAYSSMNAVQGHARYYCGVRKLKEQQQAQGTTLKNE